MRCIWNKSILKTKVYNYYDDLVKVKKVRTKNILIDAKNYKDLTIYFRRYDHGNPVKEVGSILSRINWKYDVCSNFSINAEWVKNVIIFSVDISLSKHTNNRKYRWMDNNSKTAETKYSVNITK